MEKNLGKVAITPKGTWEASTAYEQLDMVSYDGGSWLAKKPSANITPADGEYWMNMVSIAKESVVDALGFEPEKPDGEYRLIETIKLKEDTTEIIRTQEPDGTAYHYGGFIVTINAKSSVDNDYIKLWGENEDADYIVFGRLSSTTWYTQRLGVRLINGRVEIEGSCSAGNNTAALNRGVAKVLRSNYYPNDWIEQIKITVNGAILPDGVINIYASRR